MCPSCVIQRNTKNQKLKTLSDKIHCIKTEFSCINYFKELLELDFIVIKAFDGCKADLLVKPENIIENKWIGIQVKSTNKSNRGYGFHLEKNYKDFIILCICNDDKRMWLIPYNDIIGLTKISIGDNVSKYNCYETLENSIINKIGLLYDSTKKFTFEELNTPQCFYQQREQEYRKYRETKIDFIEFIYDGMEGTVYDFKIGNLKVQEKVGSITKSNQIYFSICKKEGKSNIQYNKGDNDIYWLNVNDKKNFYVIPESIFIDRGFINNSENKIHLKLPSIENQKKNKNFWLCEYKFDYDNVDKDKLLNIINVKL